MYSVIAQKSILIIEHEFYYAHYIAEVLNLHGFVTHIVSNGSSALEAIRNNQLSIIILNLDLPDENGISVLKDIRSFSKVPIVIVTKQLNNEVRDYCYKLGANDYVAKPFRKSEIWYKISKHFPFDTNKTRGNPRDFYFYSHGLEIDFITGNVLLNDKLLYLSLTEYKILSVLAHNSSKYITTKEIFRYIWDSNSLDDEGIVRVNIARLRKKLKDKADNPKYIQTEPGKGYRLILSKTA